MDMDARVCPERRNAVRAAMECLRLGASMSTPERSALLVAIEHLAKFPDEMLAGVSKTLQSNASRRGRLRSCARELRDLLRDEGLAQ